MADGPGDAHVQATLDGESSADSELSSVVQVLSPRDVFDTIASFEERNVEPEVVHLDPWYNRGEGEVIDDGKYFDFITELLSESYEISDQVFLWGYPDVIWRALQDLPGDMELIEWLTWYFKNRPSVDTGWRSSQFTCLHLGSPDADLHPEHFLTEEQLEKKEEGTLRYMPGPSSVIEASLPIGFVNPDEQTDHPSQKPKDAIEPLVKMATEPGDLVLDPMAGSGTTGAVCAELGRDAVLADQSEEYTVLMEERLGVERADELCLR